MNAGLTNLCVKIPKPMRKKIQDRQDAKDWTVEVYMNWMIETFFRLEEKEFFLDCIRRALAEDQNDAV